MESYEFDNIEFGTYDDDIYQSDKKRRKLREKADAASEQRCNTLICVPNLFNR